MIHSCVYIALMALLNHVRGGYLNKLWQATVFWKVFSAACVGLLSWVVLGLPMLPGLALGVLWWLFMLPPWADWFSMGENPTRTWGLVGDTIMMTLRGMCSVVIFGPIAWCRDDWRLALLTVPCGVLWMLGYALDRRLIKLNWSEYLAGAVIGLFIVLAVYLP